MKVKLIYILISVTVLFSSCGIFNKTLKSVDYNDTVKEETKVKVALDSIQEHYSVFNTFYSGFTGNYKSDKQNLPLKGLIKIKYDDFIWISVRPFMGIEVSRILITNDSLKVIDKLKNEYIEENLSVIKSKIGIDLTYESIQSILLNRFFVFPADNKINSYYLLNIENSATLTAIGIFSNINLSHKTNFSNRNFSIYENTLKLLDKNQSLNIIYSDFQLLNKKEFPNTLQLSIDNATNTSLINLSYKNIKINETINPTFIVPKNFKRVKFE